METLYKSEFQQIDWYEQEQIFDITWYNTEDKLTDEFYRQELQEQVEIYQSKSSSNNGVLIDIEHFVFSILPETQAWVTDNIFPRVIETGIIRLAVLVPKDIFAHVSLDQNLEEDEEFLSRTKYFEDKEEARQWLRDTLEKLRQK